MKRKDLKPGTVFRYVYPNNMCSGEFWVEEEGKDPPKGIYRSNPEGVDNT